MVRIPYKIVKGDHNNTIKVTIINIFLSEMRDNYDCIEPLR